MRFVGFAGLLVAAAAAALPGLALAHQLYVALDAQGHARSGTQALVLALASLSDVDWAGPGDRQPTPSDQKP